MPPPAPDMLPSEIAIPWAGQAEAVLKLRYALPKIWTQKESRAFGIYWSDNLCVGKLYPEPTSEELDQFYRFEQYDAYLSGTDGPAATSAPFLQRVMTKLAWYADKSEPRGSDYLRAQVKGHETVCDIGCGSGSLLSEIRAGVAAVTGVDPNPASLAALRKNGIEGFQGTAEDLPDALQGRRFDLVTMQQSLEHCRDPGKALSNIRRLCAEGGHCLIEVPNHENYGYDKYGPAWFHTDAGRHLHFFTARSVCDLLEEAGFRPLHVGYLNYTRQFGADWNRSMQEVWDRLYQDASQAPVRRPSAQDTVRDFLHSALLSKAKKYDVLRVFSTTAA